MFRIDNSTAVGSIPIIPPVGTPGFFTNGNPVTAMPATVVDDWWTNTIQEEILNVVVNAGLIPNKQDHTQLWQAINAMIPDTDTGVPDYDPFLPLSGGTLYAPLSNDPLRLVSDYGYATRIVYTVTGLRTWAVGSDTGGAFVFYDATFGGNRAYILPNGTFVFGYNTQTQGLAVFNGQVNINGPLYAYGTTTLASVGVTNNAGISGDLYVIGGIHSNGSLAVLLDISGRNYTGTAISLTGGVYALTVTGTSGIYIGNSGTYYFYDGGAGYCNFSSNLFVPGVLRGSTITAANALTSEGSLGISGAANINGNVAFGGTLSVAGGTTIGGYLQANYHMGLAGGLTANGDISCNNVTFHGQLFIGGSGGVAGSLSLSGDLSANYITAHNGLSVGTSVGIAGGCSVGGSLSANYVTVNNGLSVGTSVGIAGACTVAGDGSMNNFTANGQSVAGIQFYSNGPCYASAFNLTSDLRTKENVEDLGGGQLEAIRSLRPISYNLIDSIVADRGNRHNGFLAQEILDTPLAHLVRQSTVPHERAPEGLLAIDFAGVLASAVGAIQELADRVAELESTRSV